jgi:hypothetical protein
MSREILIIILLLFSVFISAEFVVLEQNEHELTIKFTLPEYSLEEELFEGEMFHKIMCGDSHYDTSDGNPMVPYFNEIVGLPVDGSIQFRILNKKQITETGINLIPVEKQILDGNSDGPVIRKNTSVYNSPAYYPELLLQKGNSAFLSDRHYTGFSVNPFQYKATSNELLVTKEILFKVIISGNKTVSRDWTSSRNFIDEVGDSFFLNNQYSKRWRKEKEPGDYESPRNADGKVREIQIIVIEEGIYKITKDFLINSLEEYTEENELDYEMGIDWDEINPRYLELRDEFGTIPIHFAGEGDGSFDEGDYFEFFGDKHYGDEGYMDNFTDENVYILSLEEYFGSRMAVENGGLEVTDEYHPFTNPDGFRIPDSYLQTVHFEEQFSKQLLGIATKYDVNYFREDFWFWDKINSPELEIYQFDLQYPHDKDGKTFTSKVCLFGSTYTLNDNDWLDQTVEDHHAVVRINSELINDHMWNGQREKIFENENPGDNSNLIHGLNNLYVSLPGVDGVEHEQVLLDYFDVTYWREYKTDTDYMTFTKPEDKPLGLFQFELSNFSNNNVSVYKRNSGIIENLQIESFLEEGGAPYIVTFQDSVLSENTSYCAITEAEKKIPILVKPDIPSGTPYFSLKDPSNSADYLIVTINEFAEYESTLELRNFWISKGVDTSIIDIQDIYDEFNYGIRSAQAIKDFITYVYHNWETAPTHIALLGDGTSDERDTSIDREFNIIPAKHIWADVRGAIVSDNWYGCIVGDDFVNDINVFRINVWEKEQIDNIIDKTYRYNEIRNFNELWHSSVIMAAGGSSSDHSFFSKQSERIRTKNIPESFNISRVYCNVDEMEQYEQGNNNTLEDAINEGTIYLQFMGHGGGHQWADYNLLRLQDIPGLHNENLMLAVSLSCYGGAFNSRRESCIGEGFIMSDKGAIAHIGFSGYGYLYSDEYFSEHLTDAIFIKRLGNIADISTYNKAKMYVEGGPTNYVTIALVQGHTVLGDAMNSIWLPSNERQIELSNHNLSPGDTLRFHSNVGQEFNVGKFLVHNEHEVPVPENDYYPLPLPVINGIISSEYVIPLDGEQIYSGIIKLYAYSDNNEIMGITHFAVGQTAVTNITTTPHAPTDTNEINITADFFDQNGVSDISCIVDVWSFNIDPLNHGNASPLTSYTTPMTRIQDNTYELSRIIPEQQAGYQLTYNFIITDFQGNDTITSINYLRVSGPDLRILDYELTMIDNAPVIGALIHNFGDLPTPEFNYRAYDPAQTLFGSKLIEGLKVTESRWEYLQLPEINTNGRVKLTVNENLESFGEYQYVLNELNTQNLDFNFFNVGVSDVIIGSVDGNIMCQFPEDIVSEPTMFSITNLGTKIPINQPDIISVCMADSSFSDAYQIKAFADSNFTITPGTTFELRVNYSVHDSLNQENEEDFALLYHWEEEFSKWVFEKHGVMNTDNNFVTFEMDELGIYSVFYRTDRQAPAISANVEGQEFTHGGYVSKDGTISLVLSDRNGIDIFNHTIEIALNGSVIDPMEYSINTSAGNLTNIPIKYKLDDMEEETYFLNINCTDINGNNAQKTIKFEVKADFDIIKIANYPNPVVSTTQLAENEGRTRFTYVLTDDADKVELKIYTVSGRLVKKFTNLNANIGYHEFPRSQYGWNCKDEDGFYLANGVYFYKFTAVKGEKKIEEINKMAILK